MRLVRLAIWVATTAFVFMLLYPLVSEMLVRLSTRGDSGLP